MPGGTRLHDVRSQVADLEVNGVPRWEAIDFVFGAMSDRVMLKLTADEGLLQRQIENSEGLLDCDTLIDVVRLVIVEALYGDDDDE